jgi:hypothetical protein
MMLFAAVVVIMLGTKSITLNTGGKIHGILQFLVPVMCVAGFLGGNMLFKKKLDAINGHGGSLFRRLTDYRTASLLRWAMLEGPVILAVIGLMLTGKYIFYGPFIFLMLVFFLLYAPSEEKIKMQLQLNGQEQAVLDDEYAELE